MKIKDYIEAGRPRRIEAGYICVAWGGDRHLIYELRVGEDPRGWRTACGRRVPRRTTRPGAAIATFAVGTKPTCETCARHLGRNGLARDGFYDDDSTRVES